MEHHCHQDSVESVLPLQWALKLQEDRRAGPEPFIDMVAWHILAGSLLSNAEEQIAPWMGVLQGQSLLEALGSRLARYVYVWRHIISANARLASFPG